MSSAVEKALTLLELLVEHPSGMQVSTMARLLDQPVSGVHRQLRELARLGYVRQLRDQGDYALTIRLAALGLGFLGLSGVTDIAQPILDRLASMSGELIRLSVLDDDGLTWVAVAQGATVGLRYDPGREQGMRVHPASTAGGHALLAAMRDEEVLALVGRTGLKPEGMPATSQAPKSIEDLMNALKATRVRGYSVAVNSYIEGMGAMAVAVRAGGTADGQVLGCLSIAGPAVRFPEQRMEELAPALFDAAAEIGAAAPASHYFAGILSEPEMA
ncbi:IclR family transcriptional regulator [Pseudoprimorskyibacter insulae]|uniref:Transcriptional repressor IclR n=1 Tax=Pseudoprimorskyibacter insulae TaxID=1695997 RepID=A0A2R8AY15_9RHOB|nr:IclR family transcriptional regulator [Pseudoprimorskyibacter insulae]SPF80916.1 Transcriptional repressor IclR [Pseudoprimorskyibacter insulae]